MATQITCPECNAKLRVADELAGKKLKCKSCSAVFRAPAIESDEDEEPQEQRTAARERASSRETIEGKRPTSKRHSDGDDDSLPRKRRPRERDDDDYDDRRRSRRPQPKKFNVLGLISLIKGCASLLVSFIPCFAGIAMIPAFLALGLGIFGLILGKKSKGRMGTGLPIAGISVSAAAILISGVWLLILFSISDKSKSTDSADGGSTGTNPAAKTKGADDYWGRHVSKMKTANATRISSINLAEACSADEKGTQSRYKDKVLEITGRVVKTDRQGESIGLTLEGDGSLVVYCSFGKEEKSKVEGMTVGQIVTVRATLFAVLPTLGTISMGGCVLM